MMRCHLRAVIFSLLACVLNATDGIQENRQDLSKIYLTAVNWTAQQLAALQYVLHDEESEKFSHRAIVTRAISALAQVLPPEAHATRDFLEGVADERESDFNDKVKAHFEKGSKMISVRISHLIDLGKVWRGFFEKIEKNPDSLIDELTTAFAAHWKILAKYVKSSLSTSTSTLSPEALTAMSIFRIGHGLPVVREETTEEEFKQKASEMQSFYDQAKGAIATAWASRLPVDRRHKVLKEMEAAMKYENASERYNAYASLSDDAIKYLARVNGVSDRDFRMALYKATEAVKQDGHALDRIKKTRKHLLNPRPLPPLPRSEDKGSRSTSKSQRRRGSAHGAGESTGADIGWAEWVTGLWTDTRSTHNESSSRNGSVDHHRSRSAEGNSTEPPSRPRSGSLRKRSNTLTNE